jgi:acyl transferase domain-containing protein
MAAAASEPGAMIAVTAGIEAVQELLPSGVVVANHNAPDQVVLSGEAEAVRALQATLDARGIRAVRLPVSTAFHSPLVAPAGASLARWLRDAPLHAPAPGMAWSNTTALTWPEDLSPTALADALGQHLRSPVRFVEQVRAMHAAGVRTFVEVGPGSVLTTLVGRILAEVPHVAVATDRKGEDGVAAILGALGLAAALGLPVDVSALWSARLPLPEPLPAAKAPVAINGTNSGKPWPTPATPILPPNPERVAVPTAATAPPMESTVPTPDATLAAALLEAQARAAEAHERFQRAMTESHMAFLRAQEDTTRAILAMMAPGSVAPGSVPPVVASAPPSWSAPAVPAWTAPAPPVMTRTAPPVAVLPPVALAQPAPVIAPAPPLPVAPPAHVPPAATTAPAQDLATTLLEVVADKTGYPTAMLRLEMNLEADLGIDSIKRVEILSAVRERAPETPEASADVLGRLKTLGDVVAFLGSATPAATIAAPTTSTPAVVAPPTVHAAPQVSALDLGALLLDVVADKTGYPTAMLRLDMSLEADLGIDSIKRVEILSAVRERAPHAPEADADALGRLKTLGQVADFLRGGPSATEAQARLPF